jgi:hemerythrin-like domain-containing protein
MKVIDDLRAEHELIEAVLASMRTWSENATPLNWNDGTKFVAFFRLYAGEFHHDREERLLFPALIEHLGVPSDRGPIGVLLDDHHRMAEMLDRIEAAVAAGADESSVPPLRAAAKEYSHALWAHIDAENSVLFPESEDRLRRNGVSELDSREATAEELLAAEWGRMLVARYAAFDDREAMRGDGCVMCHAYGAGCSGLEREWWNEWEWEERDEHVAAS